jgi:hypothetical protein
MAGKDPIVTGGGGRGSELAGGGHEWKGPGGFPPGPGEAKA